MRAHVLFLLCLIYAARISAEKITSTYDEAVKYCHDLKKRTGREWRLPRIRELQELWKMGKLKPNRFHWSSTCAAEVQNREGWEYWEGDCVSFWKPDFDYLVVIILDSQGQVNHHEPNSPEVKVVLCVESKSH